MAKVYFSLGSNQGDRIDWLARAAKHIAKQVGAIILVSPVVETEPWGFEAETNFYNLVLLVETDHTPQQVLNDILTIEKALGRIRSGTAYNSRIIDIDILLFGDSQIEAANLVIPHPHMHKRSFVLVPLSFIAPALVHPVFKIPIAELLSKLKENSKVTVVSTANEFTDLLKITKPN